MLTDPVKENIVTVQDHGISVLAKEIAGNTYRRLVSINGKAMQKS